MEDINTRLGKTKDYAIQCLKDEAEALMELIPQIDDNFEEAVKMMYNCHGKSLLQELAKADILVLRLLQHYLQLELQPSISILLMYSMATLE